MKVGFSPLISRASGKAADIVMASWKGRAYVRKHVIPYNPQTAAQTLVRESLTRCVTLWRSLSNVVKSWLNTYGVDYRISGWNVFVAKSRVLEQESAALVIVPANPYVKGPEAFTATGPAGAKITATWTDDVVTGFTKMLLCLRRTDLDAFEAETLEIDASIETYDFASLVVGKIYRAYGAYYNPTTGDFGTVVGTDEITVIT